MGQGAAALKEPQPTPAELLRERGLIARRSHDLAKKAALQARARWARIGELAVEVQVAHPEAHGLVDAWRQGFLRGCVSAEEMADAVWLATSPRAVAKVAWAIDHPTAIRAVWTATASDAAMRFTASGSTDIGALAEEIGVDDADAAALVGQASIQRALSLIDRLDVTGARDVLVNMLKQ